MGRKIGHTLVLWLLATAFLSDTVAQACVASVASDHTSPFCAAPSPFEEASSSEADGEDEVVSHAMPKRHSLWVTARIENSPLPQGLLDKSRDSLQALFVRWND